MQNRRSNPRLGNPYKFLAFLDLLLLHLKFFLLRKLNLLFYLELLIMGFAFVVDHLVFKSLELFDVCLVDNLRE